MAWLAHPCSACVVKGGGAGLSPSVSMGLRGRSPPNVEAARAASWAEVEVWEEVRDGRGASQPASAAWWPRRAGDEDDDADIFVV